MWRQAWSKKSRSRFHGSAGCSCSPTPPPSRCSAATGAEIADSLAAGRKFGIRYLVDGSLDETKSGIIVRCRLVETATGRQVWQERFTGEPGDLLRLYEVITSVDCRCHRTEIASGGSRARAAASYLKPWRVRLLSARVAGLLFPHATRQQRGDRAVGNSAHARSAFCVGDRVARTLRGDKCVAGYRGRFLRRRCPRIDAGAGCTQYRPVGSSSARAMRSFARGGRRRTCRRWRVARSRFADEPQQRRGLAARRLGFRMELAIPSVRCSVWSRPSGWTRFRPCKRMFTRHAVWRCSWVGVSLKRRKRRAAQLRLRLRQLRPAAFWSPRYGMRERTTRPDRSVPPCWSASLTHRSRARARFRYLSIAGWLT